MRSVVILSQSVMQLMDSPLAGGPSDMRLVDGLTFDRMLYSTLLGSRTVASLSMSMVNE